MIEQVKETIKRHDLLATGDRVLVALSGGADSVALLHVLTQLQKQYRLILRAIHIDHGIREEAGPAEEEFCRSLCDKWGVALVVETADIPLIARSSGKGIEEAARDFRYGVFERIADQLECDRIALGHHADDQSETILFRVLRGTGRTGLRGIPIKRGRYIRPLLEVTKKEIAEYVVRHQLSYCTDESNDNLSYKRNFIRHRLLPEIRERVNPAADQALRNLAETIEEEEEFLEGQVDRAMGRCVSLTPGGKIDLDLARLGAYAVWIRRRTLRRCVMAISGNETAPDRVVIARLEELSDKASGSVSLPDGIHAVSVGRRLYIYRRQSGRFSLRIEPGSAVRIPGQMAELRCTAGRYSGGKVTRKALSEAVVLDADKIRGSLTIRPVRPGDRFRPLGMRGTKKVGDYLTDRKVPKVLRDEVLVVADSRSIVWLVGFEISETVKIDSRTGKVVRLVYRALKTERGNALRSLIGSAEDR